MSVTITPVHTAGQALGRTRPLTAETLALWERFPPRAATDRCEITGRDRAETLNRLLGPPFCLDNRFSQYFRRTGLIRTLDWLGSQPGDSWQQRWSASGVGLDGSLDWRSRPLQWLNETGRISKQNTDAATTLGSGLQQLICGDVIRPSIAWLLTSTSPKSLAGEMARVRDTSGFAALRSMSNTSASARSGTGPALHLVSVVLAAKGGQIHDISVGDCLELLEVNAQVRRLDNRCGTYFYQLLRASGVFPAGAPPTVRMFNPNVQGQMTVEQLIDRYDLTCRPVRDLLVDYLKERQASVDFATVEKLAHGLGLRFWKDLENHHTGIHSLRLAPDIATAWKHRILNKTITVRSEASRATQTTTARISAPQTLAMVRAFYLDITQWAQDDPSRWAQWAAPCPIRSVDVQHHQERSRRKSRMDQRTRERLPVLPVVLVVIDQHRKAAAELLSVAARTQPGETFTVAGVTLRRSALTGTSTRIWAEDPDTAARRDLTHEEDKAFWAWASVEVLRQTGVRIEELTEISHHSLVQYALPSTGEKIPLLQIAPSKTDEERLLVVGPELADVLAATLQRVRNPDGTVPLVVAYDGHERVWNPPMPLLFQRRIGLENRPITAQGIRVLINSAMANTGLRDASGHPLTFVPHDFRRIFTTDAIMNGMPPHIAQLILGHRDINTTMGYKTVYPEEVINGHRAFIARRREARPSEEYRTPTDTEWDEFLGHFERRKVALGDCGRAYGTACIHENACVRCALLRVNPAQRPRLIEIRENLGERIKEAQREGWLGEVEGLNVNLAATNAKLAQLDGLAARRDGAVNLGIPTFTITAGPTVTTTIAPATSQATP